MFSILFGVLSAFSWGAADFTGGLASRRTNPFQNVLFGEILGLICLPVAAVLMGEPLISWEDGLWCGIAGGVAVVALALFYRAMAEGQMSIAASVSAITAAALPIVIGFFTEGRAGWLDFCGFALALAAVWLVSQSGESHEKVRVRLKDLSLPLISGAGFGFYFVLMDQGSQQGVLWPMVASRIMGVVVLSAIVRVQKRPLLPQRGVWPLLLVNFALDIAGNVFYILASQTGRMDIAAVLTSLYPGMTILLAWLILRERISRVQWLGILAALAAIVCITL